MPEFNRKQLTIIFKIAFLEAMALSIIMPSVTSSGEIPSTPPLLTQIQHGFITCTIPINGNFCLGPLTNFSPAYSTKPYFQDSLNLTNANLPIALRTVVYNAVPTKFAFQSGDSANPFGITWSNMPFALTELYGLSDMRLDWNFLLNPWSSGPLTTFCVNIDSPSNTAGAILKPQYSSDLITWNDFSPVISVNINTGAGKTCSSANLTFPPTNSYTLRVVGVGGGGVGDSPSFGNIELSIYGQGVLSVPVPCMPIHTVVSATQYRVGMSCGSAGLTNSVTYTVNWIAGIII